MQFGDASLALAKLLHKAVWLSCARPGRLVQAFLMYVHVGSLMSHDAREGVPANGENAAVEGAAGLNGKAF